MGKIFSLCKYEKRKQTGEEKAIEISNDVSEEDDREINIS